MASSLRTPFRIELEDGRTFTETIRPVDLTAAERQVGNIGRNRLQAVLYAAWHALSKRKGLDVGNYEAFLENVVDFDELDEDGDVGGEAKATVGEPYGGS